MNIFVCETQEKMSESAAIMIAAQIIAKPNSVLGFATGSTPLGTYQQIIRMYNEGLVDFRTVQTFNLDEYIGLAVENDQSYHYFMWKNLFSKVNVDKNKVSLPSGTASDMEQECDSYERRIDASGGIDIQLLGIGENGHIGFNEPADNFAQGTHCVQLEESTIKSNARFFEREEDVPKSAITMGIGTIMKAGKIILLASGIKKAEIVKQMVYGAVTPQVPASILKFHKDVTVITDREAGSLL